MNYIVMKRHQSNYPNPIAIQKGAKLKIGAKYNGAENWENWVYCYTLDNDTQGWVPKQLLYMLN